MPDKSPDAFRTISEVADWLGVQPHVLRFWESKFSQVRPVKRAGGRRYYRPNDMLLLGGIRKLLHEDGLTIKGAQKVLREEGMAHVARMSQPLDAESAALSALDVEDAAGAYDVTSAAAEPETGQILNFGSAQQSDAEQPEPDGAAAEAEEPEPDKPADEAPLPPRPNLSGTPSAEVEPEDEAEPPVAPAEEEQDGSAETAETGDESDEPPPQETPLPAFMRSSATRKAAPPESAPSKESKPEAPLSDRLPSFLQKPLSDPAPSTVDETASPPAATDAPSSTNESGEEADPPAEAPAAETPPLPKPRVVQAPDPDEAAIEVSSGALSGCYGLTRLTADQRADVLPLVSKLAALRDRMAASRSR